MGVFDGARNFDLLGATGAITPLRHRRRTRRRRVVDMALTAIAVAVAGAVIGFGLAAG